MVVAMNADLMAGFGERANNLGMLFGQPADDEEGRLRFITLERAQQGASACLRVECAPVRHTVRAFKIKTDKKSSGLIC